jgi:cytochrome c oxidase subunit II
VWFVLFAVASLFWSLAMFGWVLLPRARLLRALTLLTACAALATGIVSIASDVRGAQIVRSARRSNLEIRIRRRGDWWQLDYLRPGTSLTTANELHIPIGVAVAVRWQDAPPPWIEHAEYLASARSQSMLVAEASASRARFVSLWPPMWRTVRIVAEPEDAFERWFRNESQLAAVRTGDGPRLFESSGCGYCHVVRGVTQSPAQAAPDLTHFARRQTIAATRFPISTAYLTGWVAHSRGLKKSSLMPDNAIDPRVLHPLVAYLETLR